MPNVFRYLLGAVLSAGTILLIAGLLAPKPIPPAATLGHWVGVLEIPSQESFEARVFGSKEICEKAGVHVRELAQSEQAAEMGKIYLMECKPVDSVLISK